MSFYRDLRYWKMCNRCNSMDKVRKAKKRAQKAEEKAEERVHSHRKRLIYTRKINIEDTKDGVDVQVDMQSICTVEKNGRLYKFQSYYVEFSDQDQKQNLVEMFLESPDQVWSLMFLTLNTNSGENLHQQPREDESEDGLMDTYRMWVEVDGARLFEEYDGTTRLEFKTLFKHMLNVVALAPV